MGPPSKIILSFFFFIFLFNSVFGLEAGVSIEENSSLTKLLSGQYSLIADGVFTIKNPSNVSKIYEFNFPLRLDAFIGINKVSIPDITNLSFNNVTNITTTTTIHSGSDKFKFSFDKIYGYMVEPNETIKVGYHIYGLLNYNLYDNLKDDNQSVLDYYIESYNLVSKTSLNLQKPQREGFVYNLSGEINETPLGNTSRLISSEIKNPTDFDYFVEKLKIYRTSIGDPFFENGKVIKIINNISVAAFESKIIDVFDNNSFDDSVYWMSASIFIKHFLVNDNLRNFKVQAKPSGSSTSGGGGGGHYNFKEKEFEPLLIKKEVDKTIIRNGEEFKVTLRVININDISFYNISLYDLVPDGYEIINVDGNVKMNDREFHFIIGEIGAYNTQVFEYTLIAKSVIKGITYLKPAKLIYKGNEYFSEGILLINDLIPNDKIFVQKEVKILDDKFVRVTITIKNLGNYFLKDILITENWNEEDIVKDISQVFFKGEKGSWLIKTLNSGEEWEVSYIISRSENLDSLPNVFGVEKEDVFGTLIFSEEIINSYREEPQLVEKVGLTLAVGFLIVYLLF